MSKKLFILRHGEADTDRKWKDVDRPLTRAGTQKIREIGKRLGSRVNIDLILSSSSKRTRQTTAVIEDELEHKPGVRFETSLYEASLAVVVKSIEEIEESAGSVLLVGHNPSVSYLADFLSGERYFSFSPGQLYAFELMIDSWDQVNKGCGIIIES